MSDLRIQSSLLSQAFYYDAATMNSDSGAYIKTGVIVPKKGVFIFLAITIEEAFISNAPAPSYTLISVGTIGLSTLFPVAQYQSIFPQTDLSVYNVGDVIPVGFSLYNFQEASEIYLFINQPMVPPITPLGAQLSQGKLTARLIYNAIQ